MKGKKMLKSSINKKSLKTNSYESKVINSLRKIRDTQKELKKQEELLRTEVFDILKNKNVSELITSKYKVFLEEVITTRLDSKRLKEEQPKIYKEYSSDKISKRLQIK
jgi:predicted phage-related endonuclease